MSQFLHYACLTALALSSATAWALSGNANDTYASVEKQIESLPMKAENGMVNVSFKIEIKPMQRVSEIRIYSYDDPKVRTAPGSPSDNFTMALPIGKYYCAVKVTDMISFTPSVIIRDNIEVTGECEINIASSEAKNKVSLKVLLPDGNEAKVDKTNGETEQLIERGNIKQCECYAIVMRDQGYLMNVISAGEMYADRTYSDGDLKYYGDIYFNDIPDGYQIVLARHITDNDGTYHYILHSLNELKESVDLTTDISRYVKINNGYADIPDSEIRAEDAVYYAYSRQFTFNDRDMDGVGGRTTSRTTKPYTWMNVTEAADNSSGVADMMIMPARAVGHNHMDAMMREFYMINSPVVKVKDGKINRMVFHYNDYANANATSFPVGGGDFFIGRKYNFHPRFSWVQDDGSTPDFGNNVPVTMTTCFWSKEYQSPYWTFDFYGRYGENRTVDRMTLKGNVTVDGETVVEGEYSKVDSWLRKWCASDHSGEKAVMTLHNDNILLDGEAASNTSVITFNASPSDKLPPTLTMLNFRDKNDIITDRFATPDDGTLEFSAADLSPEYNSSGLPWFSDNGSCDIKVEYSPSGYGTWTEIQVEEVPELYFMPGFGNFYRGSLSQVKLNSSSAWYDLRTTVTDRAGNSQVQTISPAFRIESLASLSGNMAGNTATAVHVADGTLTVTGTNGDTDVCIYSTDGKKVMQFTGNSADVSALKGLYIVEVTVDLSERTIVKVVM